MVRRLAIATAALLACTAVLAQSPKTTQPDPAAAARVAAFARLYGAVRYFDPADALQQVDWNKFAIEGVHVARAAAGPGQLGPALAHLFEPLGAGVLVLPQGMPYPAAPGAPSVSKVVRWQRTGFGSGIHDYPPYQSKRTHRPGDSQVDSFAEIRTSPDNPLLKPDAVLYPIDPKTPQHADFSLGDGWKARVPLALTEAGARIVASQRQALDALAKQPSTDLRPTLTAEQRQADIVVAWSVLRHFYPYWDDVGVDWDAQLVPLLREADAPASVATQRDTLRHLVALARDGHGSVLGDLGPAGKLPFSLEPVGGALAVASSDDPAIKMGDRIDTIEGEPTAHWREREEQLSSGSAQWRRWKALGEIAHGPLGQAVWLNLDRAGRSLMVAATYMPGDDKQTVQPRGLRPPSLSELKSGVWYVDVTRVEDAAVVAQMDTLLKARAVVVDLRGYPHGSITMLLIEHMLHQPDGATWMHTPRYDAPFQSAVSYDDKGWKLPALAPRFAGKVVFLTNGSAISNSDSLLGYVTDEHLATLVGSPSAGTNGDVTRFRTPTHEVIVFTGMRVTRHDGTSRFHLIGAQPDIRVEPTLAGIRAGRDEVLERALREVH